ncbi:hypothetical protein [Xanthomonas bonasiae]|uniref:hypothetical protein n=1 Tax=Xanthomonas bonasiae TaxID=2810351 RepID=UPI00197F1E67|nr:hypothetical protein [Xanthomonas bonasiae]MBN6113381.1 hypothetical protein [Xanthomonas bonasiae]
MHGAKRATAGAGMSEEGGITFFGFRVDPKTPRARWIVFGSLALIVMAMFVSGGRASRALRERIEHIAGFDMPDTMRPAWKTREEGLLGEGIAVSQRYRLPESLAAALMHSCEQRGGRIMEREQVLADFPELESRVSAGSPACLRSADTPTRAVSLLQDTTLVIRIQRR